MAISTAPSPYKDQQDATGSLYLSTCLLQLSLGSTTSHPTGLLAYPRIWRHTPVWGICLCHSLCVPVLFPQIPPLRLDPSAAAPLYLTVIAGRALPNLPSKTAPSRPHIPRSRLRRFSPYHGGTHYMFGFSYFISFYCLCLLSRI